MTAHDENSRRGVLWTLAEQQTAKALARGAMHPIQTRQERVEQEGIGFLVRLIESLSVKFQAHHGSEARLHQEGATSDNPFLTPDPDLVVMDLSDTHRCLLNKYPVLTPHLLIVTRAFEEQESPLTLQDWDALSCGLGEAEALAFYNSGPTAGASQRHKHLQLVRLPLAPEGPKIPILPALTIPVSCEARPGRYHRPFPYAATRLDPSWVTQPRRGAEHAWRQYTMLLECLEKPFFESGSKGSGLPPYNLLITREWLTLIPRVEECFQEISINALGFAGALLVKDERQFTLLKQAGPLTALRQVARPWKTISP